MVEKLTPFNLIYFASHLDGFQYLSEVHEYLRQKSLEIPITNDYLAKIRRWEEMMNTIVGQYKGILFASFSEALQFSDNHRFLAIAETLKDLVELKIFSQEELNKMLCTEDNGCLYHSYFDSLKDESGQIDNLIVKRKLE